jgi:hypothetical protein
MAVCQGLRAGMIFAGLGRWEDSRRTRACEVNHDARRGGLLHGSMNARLNLRWVWLPARVHHDQHEPSVPNRF